MASIIRAIKADVQKVESQVFGSSQYGPIAAFFTFFQGRSTFFGILFSLVGLLLVGVGVRGFVHGQDLSSLASFTLAVAALNGSIQAMIVAHSAKEDWAQIKQQAITQQVVMTQSPSTVVIPVPPVVSSSTTVSNR